MLKAVTEFIDILHKDDIVVKFLILAANLDLMVVNMLAEFMMSRYYYRDLPSLKDVHIARRTSVRDNDAGPFNQLIHLILLEELLPCAVYRLISGYTCLDDDFLFNTLGPFVHIFYQPVKRLLVCSYRNEYHQKILPRYLALGNTLSIGSH